VEKGGPLTALSHLKTPRKTPTADAMPFRDGVPRGAEFDAPNGHVTVRPPITSTPNLTPRIAHGHRPTCQGKIVDAYPHPSEPLPYAASSYVENRSTNLLFCTPQWTGQCRSWKKRADYARRRPAAAVSTGIIGAVLDFS